MPSTATDRLFGLSTSVAVKAPCKAVATSNITLSGLQTINGVAVVEDDRVLVTAQTSSVNNGIYLASTGSWQRAADFDGARDVVQGTQIPIARNGAQTALYEVATANPIYPGTTAIAFTVRYSANLQYDISSAEVTANITPVNYVYPVGWVPRYATSGDGTSFANRWRGWEASVQKLLQLTEPFQKRVHFSAGRYGYSTSIETIGACSITGDGMGVSAIYQDVDVDCFKTTFRSAGHERVIISDLSIVGLAGGVGGTSTTTAINWIDTKKSRVDRCYITLFSTGWKMNTQASSGNSSFGNSAYASLFQGNYARNVHAQFESNALRLYSCTLGGEGAVVSTYGIVFEDAVSLIMHGCNIEGCDQAGILIQGTTANVGATYHMAVLIDQCHFESQVCDASDEGDIVIGKNNETQVLGVTVENCSFLGNGSTFRPLNVIKGDDISYLRNVGHSSYISAFPKLPTNLTRYRQEGNFSGATAFPEYRAGSANLTLAKREQLNAGVSSVGGGHNDTGGVVQLTDNQVITFEIYQATLIQVQDLTGGTGALFFATYASDVITEMSDLATLWSITNTDTNPGWAIYKSAASQTVSIKNYMNATRTISVTLLGACGGATAPA